MRSTVTSALSKWGKNAKPRDAIRATFPWLSVKLEDKNREVRQRAASAIGELAGHIESDPTFITTTDLIIFAVELHNAIEPAVPSLVQRLTDEDPVVRATVVTALSRLGAHGWSLVLARGRT